jgi:3-hydroxy-9,10-secoandrosta-1,3,5(10)-triene-9,17-dione monooxygenase reductase component
VIFVGEVLRFDRSDAPPLVFHGGRYAHATQRDPQAGAPRRAFLAGSFSEDFLGYLLGRGHFQFFSRLRPFLAKEGLGDDDFYVLSSMTLRPMMTAADLDTATSGMLEGRTAAVAQGLVQRGMLREAPVVAEALATEYELTERGRDGVLRLISAAKVFESQLVERLGAADAQVLKSLLNRMLSAIDPNAAALWGEGPPRTAGTGWQE